MPNSLKGRIVEVEENEHRVTYLTTGIKKKDQWRYRKFPGSNGTVVAGSKYNGKTIDVRIKVYDKDKCVKFDIRDYMEVPQPNTPIFFRFVKTISALHGIVVPLS